MKSSNQPILCYPDPVPAEEVLILFRAGYSEKARKEFSFEYGLPLYIFNSRRLKVYAEKGTVCVTCGLIGTDFYIEKSTHKQRDSKSETEDYLNPHLNLYGFNNEGMQMMITNDHIVPKSLGGSNDITNLQPMCRSCNSIKGNGLDPMSIFSNNIKPNKIRDTLTGLGFQGPDFQIKKYGKSGIIWHHNGKYYRTKTNGFGVFKIDLISGHLKRITKSKNFGITATTKNKMLAVICNSLKILRELSPTTMSDFNETLEIV